MSIKEEFKQIDSALKEKEAVAEKIRLEIVNLEIKREDLLGKYLLEESILSEFPWHIKGEDRWADIECNARSSDFKTLSSLAETNYHCHTQLGKGISLYFNDGRIHISFHDGLAQMAEFIKEHKLTIASSSIKKKYDKLKKDLAGLEEAQQMLHGNSK